MTYQYTCRGCGKELEFTYEIHDQQVVSVDYDFDRDQCPDCETEFNLTDIQTRCQDDYGIRIEEELERRYD